MCKNQKEGDMNENVEKVLEQIRPSLEADGGNVELVGVKDLSLIHI